MTQVRKAARRDRSGGGLTLRSGSLCKGYGGLELAAEAVLGPMEHAWYAENDSAASTVCAAHWPGVPNLGDITAVDWTAVPPVDVLTAGYPCQGESLAGKRRGIDDERWIWDDGVFPAIRDLRPRLVLLENVAGHLSMGFGRVLGDLASAGFDAEWGCFRASDVGAPHRRERVFIAAWQADCPPDAGMHARGVGVGAAGTDGVTLLPTPAARLGDGRGTPDVETARRRISDKGRRNLEDAVALLPTPAARDWRSGESNIMDRNARPLNEVIVNLLPTPTVTDAKGGRNATAGRSPGVEFHSGWTLSDIAYASRWGNYGPAIAGWEQTTGQPAPDPTETGTKGQQRLAPRFVEWLMGLPAGWVTDHLPRNAALKCLGNGVVPQQAAHAYAELLRGVA